VFFDKMVDDEPLIGNAVALSLLRSIHIAVAFGKPEVGRSSVRSFFCHRRHRLNT
jgi:hypothetical protein